MVPYSTESRPPEEPEEPQEPRLLLSAVSRVLSEPGPLVKSVLMMVSRVQEPVVAAQPAGMEEAVWR